MRVNGHIACASRGRLPLPAAGARVVEKTSAASSLKRERSGADPRQHRTPPRLQVELVCQDETARFDPFRDAPRLQPTFVAQLLGQVMAQAGANPSAQAAYRRLSDAHNRRIDRTG
jgi:hypothetical protein